MYDLGTPVLVVDDMLTMRKIVSKNLKQIGFTKLTEAADGKLAWEALTGAAEPIGLIVSDWNMPICSGLELLKKIRADEKYKDIPFLMVTAEAEKTQIMEAVKAGVTNYVVKPFTPETIKEKLEQMHQKTG